MLERATSEAVFAALEEQPYPTVTQLQERFAIHESAYALLDAHYSVRYAQAYRAGEPEVLSERLALLGDAVEAACREAASRAPTSS